MDSNPEWEKEVLELKKIPKCNENAPEYLRRLLSIFVVDFELSMQKRFDILFWKKLKSLIDEMHEASEGDRLVDVNVQNLAVGFLSDLCLLVHMNYDIVEMGIPPKFCFKSAGKPRKAVKSKTKMKVFGAHFMLRMGDLMRYKGQFDVARDYYQRSIQITPIDGSVWNQMGILATRSAQYLESVYFHTRALHATMEFSSATGNLNAIFKKFANRDTSKPMPINELFLSCLAKIHFLLPIENSEEVLEKLGNEAATSKEMIVSLMSVYQNLEGGTDLETRAMEYVNTIWSTALLRLLEHVLQNPNPSDLHLHLLALLHSASEFSDDVADKAKAVGRHLLKTSNWGSDENEDDVIKDSEGFRYFKCLHKIQYPLERTRLAELLIGDEEEKEEEVFEDESVDGEDSEEPEKVLESPKKKEKKQIFKKDDDPDSEDEILIRGRRRGREQLDSNETDDEDF